MKNKPLIFTVLSILCFIEPVVKVLYFKATTDFDFAVIFANITARNSFVDVVDFWFIFPIAGLLVMRLRKWSYFSFMAVLGYINYTLFTYEKFTWPYNSATPFFYNYFVAIASAAVFMVFLSPKIREPYFDRRVRFWEWKTRYDVRIHCKLQGDHLTFPSEILNISQSGAFVLESKYMNVGDRLLMEFNFLGQSMSFPVEVVNKHSVKKQQGFGLQFKFTSFRESIMMAKLIKVLKKSQQEFKEDNVRKFAA